MTHVRRIKSVNAKTPIYENHPSDDVLPIVRYRQCVTEELFWDQVVFKGLFTVYFESN